MSEPKKTSAAVRAQLNNASIDQFNVSDMITILSVFWYLYKTSNEFRIDWVAIATATSSLTGYCYLFNAAAPLAQSNGYKAAVLVR